jgi:heptosyltransferase-1
MRARLYMVRCLDGAIGGTLGAIQTVLFRSLPDEIEAGAVRRILIRRTGNIGDVLVALPALRAVRAKFPHAHITLLTSPGFRGSADPGELLDGTHVFDERVTYFHDDSRRWTGRIDLVRRFRARDIDLFIELAPSLAAFRGEFKQLCFARLIGARYAVGFQVSTHRVFARAQAMSGRLVRESDRLAAIVAGFGAVEATTEPLPAFEAAGQRVDAWLTARGIAADESLVAVHAGAKRPSSRWPEDRFARLIRELPKRWSCRTVLTGDRHERPLAARLAKEGPADTVVAAGETSVVELAELLRRCRLLISNDTGPMHLAAAVGTPVVALFSSRDFPVRWFPAGTGHTVLRHDVPCSPCFLDECPKGLPCLNGIEADDVLRAVQGTGALDVLP